MADWLALPALAWALPGFAVQMYGLCFGHALLAAAGSLLLILGLTVYSAAKGYNPIWGAWGVVPILGMVLLIVSPPRFKSRPREMLETILLEEDPTIRPSTISTREGPIGGVWLLALLAPLGILLVFLVPYEPQLFKALEAPRAHMEMGNDFATEPDNNEENVADNGPVDESTAAPPVPSVAASTASSNRQEEPPPPAQPPAPESNQPPPAPPSFADKYRQVVPGMTVEQVLELCGDKIEVVSEMLGDRIVKWESPEGDSFAARFNGGKLDLKTSLHKAPAKTQMKQMTDEIADVEMQDSMTPKNPPSPPPAEPARVAPAPEDENDGADEDGAEAQQPAPSKVIRIGGEAKEDGRARKARLPRFTYPIDYGPNGINLYNLKGSKVMVGIRSDNRGQNVSIPPGGTVTINIPNGYYTVYFIDASAPTDLKNAGGFQVNSPPITMGFAIR